MENFKKLQEVNNELASEFQAMSKEQLLDQISAEVLDLFDMQDRVQLFMNECTEGMSKTTYDLDVIKQLISEKQEADIDRFCSYFIEDNDSDAEIIQVIKERGRKYLA